MTSTANKRKAPQPSRPSSSPQKRVPTPVSEHGAPQSVKMSRRRVQTRRRAASSSVGEGGTARRPRHGSKHGPGEAGQGVNARQSCVQWEHGHGTATGHSRGHTEGKAVREEPCGVCWQEGMGSTAHPPTAHRGGECGPGVCTEVHEMQPGGSAQSIQEASAEASRTVRSQGRWAHSRHREWGIWDANGAVRGMGHRTLNLCGLGSEQ